MELRKKVEKIKKGEISCVENVLNFSKKISTPESKELNIFLRLNEDAIEQAKEIDRRIKGKGRVGKLAGLCFAVKSNIAVRGMETNCASRVLQGYVSAYNATVVNRLIEEDAVLLGMVNMDEFACGTSGESSFFGPTKNPKNPKLITGGSSSGSAAAVSAGLCDFSIGSDTGGSIRNPSSHCGVFGLKPTYGAVSRYGLIDLSMSLDCIGPITKNSEDSELIFEVIRGQDNFDTTTVEKEPGKKTIKRVGLANVEGFCDERIMEETRGAVLRVAKDNGLEIVKVDLPIDISLQTYYIIVYAEFFSATRKFDGRRFGVAIDEFAGPEIIRRITGGSEITLAEHEGRFYEAALGAKSLIKKRFEEVFDKVDVVALPTVPCFPHKIGEKVSVEKMYNYDILTTPSSIAEIPAASVPLKKINGFEVGLQVLAPKFHENLIFQFAKLVEKCQK
ncbi:Asp-tRNA(Asn)/Glu-tRNA(Gln) amidotransferase subunit GatA [Candidatus Pacearchaeota archaeon]|nr:MAG: Asp-tRNA(Asn)/Glu-tRNA(Gln) amidotransferase subunit GatA [Candidatus Pacearchaeota archaeon]